VGNPERKRPLGRTRRRCEDTCITKVLKKQEERAWFRIGKGEGRGGYGGSLYLQRLSTGLQTIKFIIIIIIIIIVTIIIL
jgi:hypothetical protein